MELNTIQKREKLNTVIANGVKGSGNAYHEYEIIIRDDDNIVIPFQNGGLKEMC